MHPFQSEINEILIYLQEAYSKIEKVHNPDMLLLRNRILLDMKRHIDMLKLQLGIEPGSDMPQLINPHSAPIKKLFGKDVTTPGNRHADVNKPFQQTPEDVELAELRLKADELYPRFLVTPSDNLLDSVSDIEIRAVAKRAGLPVTETNPQRITVAYIDQIKKAIQQHNVGKEISDDTISVLARSKEVLYTEFSATANKEILELYSEPEVREVARMAGLPVTENSPPKIDKKFLDQIKAAINKKAELEEIAGNV
jgi:hypothetical protein